ncbi:DUF914-domain-containing protein [Eremomyces bilateralis CBS 781.70]|uniref:DUF914-domain-containing protein n=1 Tax=Eremomyces bilateralis CBS 781.70 TaxID=1392243 RepID=A0A6G1G478_9PEZI|nr:DUF914-domain-containing protein [Eremomyces bilateralis CBS 781.70]KAF1812629.1 DUF914-domain-containing protein [Eremomyces bilateralis CBS 781.70]
MTSSQDRFSPSAPDAPVGAHGGGSAPVARGDGVPADEIEGPHGTVHSDKAGDVETADADAASVTGGTAAAPARVKAGIFTYFRTRQFWIVLVLGQILALCLVGTGTFSNLLANKGTNIPAFQTFFNYVLLNIVYTSITIYRYGFKKWANVVLKDGWKYFIFAFMDVEGNYFVVLAYGYTTIMSAQLINFWAIVVVVLISLIFLRVRYHLTQYVGILLCIGGMGVLIASDHLQGTNGGAAADPVRGDLFCLLSATFYGLSNVFEEFLISRRPMYEVVGQLAFWGMLINGVQAAIFDRASFRAAVWDGPVFGYLVGYTLILFTFYSLAPVVFRMSSAAFFNIGLLTANFWTVVVGIKVFQYAVHWMYPIAFVLIVIGLFVYFMVEGGLGEAKKPWLGENQERGVSGLGTAKRRLENPEVTV